MKYTLSLLFILAGAIPLSADALIGWIGKASSTQLIDIDAPANDFTGSFSLKPTMKMNWENLEFTASAELEYLIPQYETDFTLKEFYLSYSSDSFWKINTGRFHYLPGNSEFFSNTNYFSATDYIELIENQGEDFNAPGDMLQIIIAGESLYLNATTALTPVEQSQISLSSPWFPHSMIPSTLYTFSGDTYNKNDVFLKEFAPPMAWEHISTGIEGGWSTYLFDISLQYYHGWSNDYIYQTSLDLRDDGLFDTTIAPLLWMEDSFGLNCSLNLGSFHTWLDSAFTLNKTFTDTTLRVPGFSTMTDEAPFLENTLGIRYDFNWQYLTLIAEWKESYAFSENERLTLPYFNSALAAAFTMAINEYRHQPGGFVLYSLEDKSWMSALQWKFNIKDYLSLEGTAAWLQGEEGSFFGQYDQDLFIACNMVWRY